MKNGMIKLSVLYPNGEGKTFDMDYYTNSHIPMMRKLLGDACKGVQVELGLSGLGKDVPAPFAACGHLYFDNIPEFQESINASSEQALGDIPNFTNIEPLILVSEVKI